jgi:hypothetical protein
MKRMNSGNTWAIMLILSLVCSWSKLKAQDNKQPGNIKAPIAAVDTTKKDTSADDDCSNIVFSAKAGNNFTYRGLSAEKMPYLSPDITYNAKSGFWASVTTYRVWSSEVGAKKFLETDFAAGWDFTFFKKWDFTMSYMHSNYDTASISPVKSALANNIDLYTGYDFGPIYFGVRYDYTFERKNILVGKKKKTVGFSDYYFNWELYKDWGWADVFTNDDEIHLIPDVSLTGGTQSVYSDYLDALTAKKVKVRNAGVVKAIKEPSKFSIFLFNFSAPISYYIGNWKIKPEYDLFYFTTKDANGKTEPPYSIYSIKVAYTINFKNKGAKAGSQAKGGKK